MMNFRRSGKYYEYRALEYLGKQGFRALRIPTSATGTQPLPDIIATKDHTVFPIEVKSTTNIRMVVEKHQVEKLFEFCEVFSFCECQPAILVFFKHERKVIMKNLTPIDRGKNIRVDMG